MEYILFIHNNVEHPTTEEQWTEFFAAANESGMFSGGSEISAGRQIGSREVVAVTDSVIGYMRFETDDLDKLNHLLDLHPVRIQGGTLELCETPKNNSTR